MEFLLGLLMIVGFFGALGLFAWLLGDRDDVHQYHKAPYRNDPE